MKKRDGRETYTRERLGEYARLRGACLSGGEWWRSSRVEKMAVGKNNRREVRIEELNAASKDW